MWIMTSWGVIMPSLRPVDTLPEGDAATMQLRTRRRVELERVCEFYPEIGLKSEDIIFMSHTDYEYRLHCTPTQLAVFMMSAALDINYTKFKPSTEEFGESKLHQFYNRVWGIYYDMFSTNRYLEQKTKRPQQRKRSRQQEQPVRKNWWDEMNDEPHWGRSTRNG
jgi:hypothetical protein